MKETLEEKFQKIFQETQNQIKIHINNARQELQNAVDLSEQTGIPFRSEIVDLKDEIDRLYFPVSFDKKWKKVKNSDIGDLLADQDLLSEYDEIGWTPWMTSSLTC